MAKVRTVHYSGRNWNVFDYLYFFHDQDGIFETSDIEQVLSYLERVGNPCHVTREEIDHYLQVTYNKGASLEVT